MYRLRSIRVVCLSWTVHRYQSEAGKAELALFAHVDLPPSAAHIFSCTQNCSLIIDADKKYFKRTILNINFTFLFLFEVKISIACCRRNRIQSKTPFSGEARDDGLLALWCTDIILTPLLTNANGTDCERGNILSNTSLYCKCLLF